MTFIELISKISPLIVVVVNFPLGLFIYLKDRRNQLYLYYFLFVILLCLGAFSCFVQGITKSDNFALYADVLFYLSLILIPFAYSFFMQFYISKSRRKVVFFFIPFALILMLINFTPLFRIGVVLKFDVRYIISPSFGWYLFLVYFSSFLSVSFMDLFFTLRESSGLKRKNILYFFIGSILIFVSLAFYFLLIVDINNKFLYSLFNFLSSLFVILYGLFMAYNITYLKFFDVDTVIKRSYFFIIFYFFGIMPVVLLVNGISNNSIPIVSEYSFFITAFIWAVFIIVSDNFKEFLSQLTDKIFYAADYNYDKVLDRVNRKLSETTDIYFLLFGLQEDIRKYFKVTNVGLFLPNKTRTKFYYVDIDSLDNYVDVAKRKNAMSIRINHPLFSKLKELPGNILDRGELVKNMEYNDDPSLSDILTIMDSLNAEVIVASLLRNRISGIIVVDKKRGGGSFKHKDFKMLKFMANQCMLVLTLVFEIEEKTRLNVEKKMLMNHKQKLEEKNVELQRTLYELNEAQRKLLEEEQLLAMGRLAGEVAHDIRNPLSSMNRLFLFVRQENLLGSNFEVLKNIYTNIEKLELTTKEKILRSIKYLFVTNQEVQSVMDETMQINDKLRKIADDFLDYSRISKDIPTEKINIFKSLDRMVSQFQVSDEVKKNGVKVSVSKAEEIYVLMFDHQLQKVFANIIDNAVKAVIENERNEKTVEVICYKIMMQNRNMVCVSIMDNGVGIDTEHIPTIFKPFYTKRKNLTGTGLGLAIVKKIVDNAGGEITVESSESGTIFKIFLPCFD